MGDPQIDVVVRCRIDAPCIDRTLGRLLRQKACTARIVFLDYGASTGARSAAEKHGIRVIDVSSLRSTPGSVMNRAMRLTESSLVAFVDADAVPLSETSLSSLSSPFASTPALAAAFGRQIARQAITSLTRELLRGERALGAIRSDGSFSMAAAIVRRTAWDQHPFEERLRYAEDIAWATRLKRNGWASTYVAGAPFERSQEATLRQHFARLQRPTPLPRSARPGCVASQHRAMLDAAIAGSVAVAPGV